MKPGVPFIMYGNCFKIGAMFLIVNEENTDSSASPPAFYIRQLWVMNACSAYRAYFWARDRVSVRRWAHLLLLAVHMHRI